MQNSMACSSLNVELRTFRISEISIRSKDIQNFRFLVFLTVCAYFKTYLNKSTVLIDPFMLNSEPLEFLRYL